jgi:hypothetical protein
MPHFQHIPHRKTRLGVIIEEGCCRRHLLPASRKASEFFNVSFNGLKQYDPEGLGTGLSSRTVRNADSPL